MTAPRLSHAPLLAAAFALPCWGQPAADPVEALLAQMTVEEKAGHMTLLTLEALSSSPENATSTHKLDMAKVRAALVDKHVGGVLNQWDAGFTPPYWREVIGQIQDVATTQTRLKIPVIYGVDSVHGANYILSATLFPQNLTLAATWNPALARRAGQITAAETRAVGINWNYAPVCDVGRQPLWSRFFETFGEDPTLCAIMAAETIRGMQGDGLASPTGIAACGKHFLAYSLPRSGKDRTPTQIGPAELHDIFVPPFRAAFDAGVASVMVNSGEINGVPVHASPDILTGLLREQMGFQGLVVTDWEDVGKLAAIHRVAENEKDAARLAVLAGIDMSMVPLNTRFADQLVELVKEGALTEARLDASVRRILRTKRDLGLFEQPMPDAALVDTIGSPAHAEASLAAAREGIVLLRNRGALLPLPPQTKVLVTGPTADALQPVYGAWSYTWQGREGKFYPDSPTMLDALRAALGEANVAYQPGASYNAPAEIDAAVKAAADADVVVLCLGEEPATEKPGDINDLTLPAAQLDLAAALAATGKRVILVLFENRPRLFPEVEAEMDAVLWAGHPGPFGPQAVAEILTGVTNPSGKLPFTYPQATGDLVTYDRKHAEDQSPDFQANAYRPLFEFGSGLSFTSFAARELSVTGSEDGVVVTVTVANTGPRAGAEVVQLYVSDLVASVTPHVQRLKGFRKITLDPGQQQKVTFELSPDDLAVVRHDGSRAFEPGAFAFRVGDQRTEARVDPRRAGGLSVR